MKFIRCLFVGDKTCKGNAYNQCCKKEKCFFYIVLPVINHRLVGFRLLLSVNVVVVAKHIHCLEELMEIDERSYQNEASPNFPPPEVARAEVVVQIAAIELVPHSRTEICVPDERIYPNRQP